VEEFVERIAETARPVAAAALNAGVGVNGAFVGETKLEDHLREVDLNVRSTVHLAYLLLPWMVQAGEGRMLFTSSIAATTPGPFMAVYNASKTFVKSFAEALREELRDTGVTVTTFDARCHGHRVLRPSGNAGHQAQSVQKGQCG
jgi:short-subunit dehydrogenase